MTVILNVSTKECVYVGVFDSVTQAYKYYLKYFATIGDKWYYYKTSHTRLKSVTDEETMEAIFRNVFKNAFIVRGFERA